MLAHLKRNSPDGLLLLLAQALPGFQPTVANDVDPNQDNLVNLRMTNSYIEQSNSLGENLQHPHRQIQCSRILSSCQSRATPDQANVKLVSIGVKKAF